MEEQHSTQRLMALRRSTRAIADLLRAQMKDYLSTLSPLFHPRNVLGSYAEGGTYEAARTGERPFKELRDLYQTIAVSKKYSLPSEFRSPLEVINTNLEMTPVEYQHVISKDGEQKTILVTSPLKWALTYRGFGPVRFQEVVHSSDRSTDQLQQFVLHYLMMHSVIMNQPGIRRILEGLHFPIVIEYLPEFGELPLTYIASSVSTIRPPDEVLIESSEVSGMNVFEELVQVEDISKLRDPLKEQLLEITKGLQ
jgi:hypothetical protein